MQLPALPSYSFRIRWDSDRAAYYVSKPNIEYAEVYSEQQMTEYGQDCSDRALEAASQILFNLSRENPTMRLVWLGAAKKILELKL